MKRYDAYLRTIRPALKQARANGALNSIAIAYYLNEVSGIAAPNGKPWNKNSILRAIRRLKSRGLDAGFLPLHIAQGYL